MIVIGTDTHKGSHAMAAVDEGTGRVRGHREIKAEDAGHQAALRWARDLDPERVWAIENYHRGLKQCCGVERCQARAGRAQRNHIGMAIRAFLRLERHFYATGVSWYEAKARIYRPAVRAYLANPLYKLS